jgi:hypothetical protein
MSPYSIFEMKNERCFSNKLILLKINVNSYCSVYLRRYTCYAQRNYSEEISNWMTPMSIKLVISMLGHSCCSTDLGTVYACAWVSGIRIYQWETNWCFSKLNYPYLISHTVHADVHIYWAISQDGDVPLHGGSEISWWTSFILACFCFYSASKIFFCENSSVRVCDSY